MSKNALLEKKLKDMIAASQLRMQELSIQVETLDDRYQQLFDELEITPDQLKEHAEDQTKYEMPIWEFLQEEKQKIEKAYEHDANSVRDIKKVKRTFSERKSIQQHWIHVR